MQQATQRTQTPEGDAAAIDALLAERRIASAFQPIVDLTRGVVAGYEALARPKGETPFRHAGELFEAAARTDRLWALETAARESALRGGEARWPAGARLFLNCSPAILADPEFPAALEAQTRAHRTHSPGSIVVEITERSEDQHVPGLSQRVAELKQMGFEIAIDDVGAGTSGLNRIMLLRPRWLKLDRELVTGIDRDRVRQNLVRFMLHFGRLSGVQIIAEGIETDAELETLIGVGVTFGQGFLIARPHAKPAPLDPELVLRMRRLSASAEDARSHDNRAMPASRYATRVPIYDCATPIAQAAAILHADPACPGACVVDCGRLVGWCERGAVLETPENTDSIASLARPCTTADASGTTVPDAVELAACRDPDERQSPIVLTDGDEPVLVLTPADLLRAAADLSRAASNKTQGLNSLPGRVACDQHLLHALLDNRARSAIGPGPDAIFIDVRDLTSFNCTYGYELGDELLLDTYALIDECLVDGRESVFVGRLGDDRFFVLAPSDDLEARLLRLTELFEELACSYQGLGTTTTPISPSLGVRALVVRDALRRVQLPHELYRREGPLRKRADALRGATRSQVVFDPPQRPLRRSA